MERKQIFSIKKLKIGVASVLIGTGWVIAGGDCVIIMIGA